MKHIACFVIALPLLTAHMAHSAEKIALGKTVERTIEGDRKGVFGNPGMGAWYQYEFVVRLTAGQSVNMRASVLGKERLVNIVMAEPKGTMISPNPGSPREKKSIEVNVDEVSATGDYKILVVSDLIGKFTFTIAEAGEEDSVKMLEDKLEELKKEMARIEVQLKAAREKARKN